MTLFPFLGGIGLFGLLQGLSGTCLWRFDFMRESVAMCTAGNLLAGVPLWVVLGALRKLLGALPASASTAFWGGACFGIASFFNSPAVNIFAIRDNPSIGLWLGFPLLVFAPWLGRKFPVSEKLANSFLVISLFGWAAAWADLVPEGMVSIGSLEARTHGLQVSVQTPDVLLVSIDTLRADAVVGPESADVPNLDALRAEGFWANGARSSGNQTIPGHTGMLTGLSTLHHRVLDNKQHFPRELEYLADYFHRAGWHTAGVVSNALLSRPMGPWRGFELYDDKVSLDRMVIRLLRRVSLIGSFLDFDEIDTVASTIFFKEGDVVGNKEALDSGIGKKTTDQALKHIETLSGRPGPFFMFLHYMDPHAPYVAPAPWSGRLGSQLSPGAGEAAVMRAKYLEEVEFVDYQFGRVLAAIKENGRPTVVLVTGDHGEFLFEHDLTGHSHDAYEEVLKVPFILAGNGIPRRMLDEVHLADIVPTLLGRCGIEFDQGLVDGVDLIGFEYRNRFHVARDRKWVAMTEGEWKWMSPLNDDGLPIEGAGGFVNLSIDPNENDWPSKLIPTEEFLATVSAATAAMNVSPNDLDVSEEQRLLLRELGYADLLEE
jgi:hypothetical protein